MILVVARPHSVSTKHCTSIFLRVKRSQTWNNKNTISLSNCGLTGETSVEGVVNFI
jgi:hypothetical protein